jgi:hypothetical protein
VSTAHEAWEQGRMAEALYRGNRRGGEPVNPYPAKKDDGRIDAELEAVRLRMAAAGALEQAVNNENAAAWVLAEALDAAASAERITINDTHVTAALVQYRKRRTEAEAKRAAMRRLRGSK